MIDFLSIRKVIIFSAIATDGRHPLWSRSIHQKCCKLHDDSFPRYCATEGGVRKTYCARSRNDVDVSYQSVELHAEKEENGVVVVEDVLLCRKCSKARPNVSR